MSSLAELRHRLSTSSSLTTRAIRTTQRAILLSGILAASSAAWAQATLPDAQIEANVLKALAAAPELANEAIRTTTVYGTVTLSGSVHDEALRTRAENLAANATGVKKVVDEMTLGTAAVSTAEDQGPNPALANQATPADADATENQGTQPLLQSDGTMAAPAAPQQAGQPMPASQADQPDAPQGPLTYPNGHPVNPGANANNTPGQFDARRPMSAPPYGYSAPPIYPGSYAPNGGQQAGLPVSIPSGTLIRVRINQRLASDHSQPGSTFDGVVTNDIVAGGAIAIPRGAAVQGKVVESKSSGVLKGRGELSIELTSVSMGGKVYPLTSDLWSRHGGDKTIETVNKTAGFGALGALLGAAAGGGVGAAVGGGIGAAAGLGSSAASGNGQVYVPSEGVITFHLAQELAVNTVSEQEMQRLAYGVPVGAQPPMYRRPRPQVYYGPVYYPYGYYYPRYYRGY